MIDRAPSDLVASVPDPAWLSDPASPNYVAPERRDANAVALLSAFPAPNTGSTQYRSAAVNEQRTRQEVLRLDWNASPRWRLMARYTHDLSRTSEPGGLFFNTPLPDLAATRTRVPGQVFVAQLTATLGPRTLNELSLQYSGNSIESEFAENARSTRAAFGLEIPELFPENRGGLVPQVSVTGPLGDRRQPAVRELVPQRDARGQPVAPARQPHAQGRPARRLRAEERAVDGRDPGQLRVRRGRRAHGLPELPRPGTPTAAAEPRAPTPSRRRRPPPGCAGAATRPSSRTPGSCGPGWSSTTACASRSTPASWTRTTS